jgi:hypothetical protein
MARRRSRWGARAAAGDTVLSRGRVGWRGVTGSAVRGAAEEAFGDAAALQSGHDVGPAAGSRRDSAATLTECPLRHCRQAQQADHLSAVGERTVSETSAARELPDRGPLACKAEAFDPMLDDAPLYARDGEHGANIRRVFA